MYLFNSILSKWIIFKKMFLNNYKRMNVYIYIYMYVYE